MTDGVTAPVDFSFLLLSLFLSGSLFGRLGVVINERHEGKRAMCLLCFRCGSV